MTRIIRKGNSRPLVTQTIRHFSTLPAAVRHLEQASRRQPAARFAVMQNDSRYTVARIIAGGAS